MPRRSKARQEDIHDGSRCGVLLGCIRKRWSVAQRVFDRRSFFDLSKLCFPPLSGVQPKRPIFIVGRLPYKLAAFIDLSLEENFFVEHGCVKSPISTEEAAPQIWTRTSRRKYSPAERDALKSLIPIVCRQGSIRGD